MPLPHPQLSDIPDEGLAFTSSVEAEELGWDAADGRFEAPLTLQVHLICDGQRVLARGELSGTCNRECVRCLKSYADPVQVPFEVEYHSSPVPSRGKVREPGTVPKGREGGRDEADEAEAEPEEGYPCVGERVELGPMLREHLLLSAPMQPLCSPECRGLCHTCGQDLNVTPCACRPVERETPFSVLRQWRDRPAKS